MSPHDFIKPIEKFSTLRLGKLDSQAPNDTETLDNSMVEKRLYSNLQIDRKLEADRKYQTIAPSRICIEIGSRDGVTSGQKSESPVDAKGKMTVNKI